MRVPVAPPQIVIIQPGQAEPVWREPPVAPENEIFLTGFPETPPADVRAAVAVLRAALPADWLAKLVHEYGFRFRGAARSPSGRTDLRTVDLASFLFDRWIFSDLSSRLARELDCISPGERDISVLLTLVAFEEAWELLDTDRLRRDPPVSAVRYAAERNARAALGACIDLVDRGWAPDYSFDAEKNP